MRLRCVRYHHHVLVREMLEKIEDALLLHEPAGEIEIRLAILNTEISRLVIRFELVLDFHPGEYGFQDILHSLLLKDAALRLAAQQPELGDEVHVVRGKDTVPPTFAQARAYAVEITHLVLRQGEPDRNLLAEE